MKKISKMTWIKILLPLAVIGTMIFFVCKWNVKLDPPRPIKEVSKITPTQMVIDVVIPECIKAEQIDVDLSQRDPEAYANRFNSNNELYNRSLEFAYQSGVRVGDTVQLSYCSYFNYNSASHWDLVSVRPPFREGTEQTESRCVEYIKGVIRGLK